jgi:hypothetical protein
MHEEMEQRTKGEQDDGERAERVRTMLGHEEKRRDREKTEQREQLPLSAHGHPLRRRDSMVDRADASRQSSLAMMPSRRGCTQIAVMIPLELLAAGRRTERLAASFVRRFPPWVAMHAVP